MKIYLQMLQQSQVYASLWKKEILTNNLFINNLLILNLLTAPAHSKFQPRARLGPKKGPLKPKPSAVPTKEKQVLPIPLDSIASVDSSLNASLNSSSGPKVLAASGEDTKFKNLGSEPENVGSVANKRDSDVIAMSESSEGKSSRNMTAGVRSATESLCCSFSRYCLILLHQQ